MYIARKNASTTDERSKGIDSQDPFLITEIPIVGAIVNPILAPVTSALASATVATLNTTTIGYGSFGARDASDHYQFTATPGKTYSLVVTTDTANPNITTQGFGDYFDIYFESNTGARLTTGAQIKDLDAKTKLVEFTVPGTGTTPVTYYAQVDNAYGQPFQYAIALYDKSVTPKIAVTAREVSTASGSGFEVTFTSDVMLVNTRPRTDRIEVNNGTLGSLVRSADGKSYTATFTPSSTAGNAAGSIKVLTGAFFSVDGNPNLDGDEANNFANIAADTTPPKLLSVTSSEAVLSGASKPTLTFKFSEAVQGFTASDVAVTGGTLSNFQGSGDTYTAVLNPAAGAAEVKLAILKGSYTDASRAKNASIEDFSAAFAVDIVAPTAELTIDKAVLSAGETATVTIRFSESVKGFALEDLTSSGGTLSNFKAVGTDGRTYTASVTPSATDRKPEITVSLKAGSVTDAAGNANAAAATSNKVAVDSAPAVTQLTTSDNLLGRAEKATITVVLSEASDDFTREDLTVQGGTLGSTLTRSADGKTYTIDFTPRADFEGPASISIAANSFTSNSLKQANKNAAKLDFAVDTKLPTVAITSDKAVMKPGETSTLKLVFSEAVTGLTLDDLSAQDGQLSALTPVGTDGKVYTVTLATTSARNSRIEVTLKQDAIADAAGNQLASAGAFTQEVDYSPSVTSITVDDAELGSSDSAVVTIQLSDSVTDFSRDDLEAQGGTIVDFFGSGSTYYAVVEPDAGFMGTGKVTVKSGAFSTVAGGANRSAATVTFAVDTVAPTLSITTSDAALTQSETAVITFTLSEAATDFTLADITATGGTLSNFAGSGKVYTAVFTPTDNTSTIGRVQVAAGKFQDGFGNLNSRGYSLNFSVDTKAVTPPPSGGGGTPPTVSKLELVEQAVVRGNAVVFTIKDAAANNTRLEFAGVQVTDVQVKKDGSETSFTPQPGSAIDAGILIVTNGTDQVDLGLDLALGTDGDDTLSFADPDPAIDPATGESVLVASALFGFGGNDILIEGASTTAMVGGEGIDEYRLQVGVDAPTLIVENGSPLMADLIAIPGVIDSYYGFDIVRGFDVDADTLMITKGKKVVGTFIDGYNAFVTGGLGNDLLVFSDANDNGVIDEGETGVVLVGVGASASTVNVVGG